MNEVDFGGPACACHGTCAACVALISVAPLHNFLSGGRNLCSRCFRFSLQLRQNKRGETRLALHIPSSPWTRQCQWSLLLLLFTARYSNWKPSSLDAVLDGCHLICSCCCRPAKTWRPHACQGNCIHYHLLTSHVQAGWKSGAFHRPWHQPRRCWCHKVNIYLQSINVAAGDLVPFMENLLHLQAQAGAFPGRPHAFHRRLRSLLFVDFYTTQYV